MGDPNGTIWLVGMMGAGKSTVGRALARRLRRPFSDLDREIEREAGCKVAEIFEREGESGFRARERRAIAEQAGRAAVVALGGGAIAQPGAAERLAASGTVVYLKATPETLLERIGEARTRPLLRDLDGEERLSEIRRLLEERRAAYESATVVVETDGRGVATLAAAVAGELE